MTEQELFEIFNNLRYHYENEVVEFKKAEKRILDEKLDEFRREFRRV